MLETPVLTNAQIVDFNRDGFVVVREAFGAQDVQTIDAWSRELAALPEQPGRHWVFHEKSLLDSDTDLISRIENISPYHVGFATLADVLKASVGQLLGKEAVLFKEKINFKMRGAIGFEPHQDAQAGWADYAPYFVTVAICLDEATLENGCLKLAAGHHRRGLFRLWDPLTEEDMAGMEFVPYPTKPGDVVFIDCYAPHGSEANLTSPVRRLYFATYNRLSEGDHMAQYYADKRKNYPPDIEREPGREYVFRV